MLMVAKDHWLHRYGPGANGIDRGGHGVGKSR
jgi:hypothetical protein